MAKGKRRSRFGPVGSESEATYDGSSDSDFNGDESDASLSPVDEQDKEDDDNFSDAEEVDVEDDGLVAEAATATTNAAPLKRAKTSSSPQKKPHPSTPQKVHNPSTLNEPCFSNQFSNSVTLEDNKDPVIGVPVKSGRDGLGYDGDEDEADEDGSCGGYGSDGGGKLPADEGKQDDSSEEEDDAADDDSVVSVSKFKFGAKKAKENIRGKS